LKRFTIGADVAAWIEENCVYPSGAEIGAPFRLMEWQRDWLNELYECTQDGLLRYRWALLGIPKGNGKSTLIAAIALYHLLGDPAEADPWVVCAAASDKQADIVFNAAKMMCEMSPLLKEATERYRWEIRPKGAAGKLERVAASAGKLDGKNISLLLVDELHEWTLENWTILTNGAGKRRRSQIVQITTAGYDRESICYREYEKGRRIEAGEMAMSQYLFRWYGAPEGSDHHDEAVWEAANPSYGRLMTREQIADKAQNIPESQFRRYFLNQWTEAEELWLPHGAWEALASRGCGLVLGAPTYVGWDASTKHDSTAVVTVQHVGDKLRVLSRIWERPLDPNGNPVEDWMLPMIEVEEYVRYLWRTYHAQEIAYDPAFITWKAQELAAEGVPMIEFFQTDSRMVPATQTAYDAVLRKQLEHDGDPVLARHVKNAVAVQTSRGGQRLTKGKLRRVHNQIDGAVALVMALDRAMRREQPRPLLDIGFADDLDGDFGQKLQFDHALDKPF
jgi:phage terminase large subunit-like protein